MAEEEKKKQHRRIRITRDTAILSFAIGAGTFEILFGGARPSVLTFLTGVFLSPLIMRVDERTRSSDQEK